MRFSYFLPSLILAVVTAELSVAQDNTFNRDIARKGFQLSQVDCRWRDTSVWVQFKKRGECLRYFHAGLSKGVPVAHLFIHGDINLKRYRSSQDKVQSRVDREHDYLEMPHIWLSRPGLFGSTGHYRRYRRSQREFSLVNRAVDAIKKKYQIGRFHLSGQSSGGRLVGLLLSKRNDVGCAVSASGGLAQ